MISVEEALERILGQVSVLEAEARPLLQALGQVTAEDVYAPFDVPPADNSAMDGYAARGDDTRGANEKSPRLLKVIGEVACGYTTELEVTPGTAIRIMTGAPIPKGADTVVQFEHTDESVRRQGGRPLTEIGIMRQTEPGMNIRLAAEDIKRGSLALRKGTELRPAHIGVLASLGKARVSVIRRPVVAVLATGDELVEVGKPLPEGKIYNSNTYSLAAQVQRYGGIPKILGIARDNLASMKRKVTQGLTADLLLTSAGVSTGDYDVVKDVLAQMGEINFYTVRMKPGKPLAFGVLRQEGRAVPHLGLPGNPVSSMITFEEFARPAILKMMGKTDLSKPTVQATSLSEIANKDGRRIYARVVVSRKDGRYFASVTGPQGSGIMTSMADANGLMIVPEDTAVLKAGDTVEVQLLELVERQGN